MNSKSETKRQHLFREVLRKKGKTFWFASFFLNKDAAQNASILYAFCRLVDDLAVHDDVVPVPVRVRLLVRHGRRADRVDVVIAQRHDADFRFAAEGYLAREVCEVGGG